MAEIKIEKKSPIWPWILLIVIVVGILIYVFASDRDDDNSRERPRENTQEPLNSLPDTPNSEVTLISIITDGPDRIGLG